MKPEKIVEVCLEGLIALPKIAAALDRLSDVSEKLIAGRQDLIAKAKEAVAETPAKTETPAKKVEKPAAKPAPEPELEPAEEEEEEDLGLGEEEEEQPPVKRKDIQEFVRAEIAKGGDHATHTKAAFSVVRREMIGEVEGKPKDLSELPPEKAGAFLTELKRKIKALS